MAGIDHFGRKTFDELQLGTGFIGRTYAYESGGYDSEKLNGKLQSVPETDIVNKIAYYNGKELRYTYNEAGDITRVRDKDGNLLEAYSYDELGRIKTEQNVKGEYYTVYTYDAGGNIRSKTKYNCASTSAVTGIADGGTTYTYTYDSVWKDRLTGYSGYSGSMSYVGGNPASYKGLAASWEKGRQLKQLGTNSYKYNSGGIRIGKTVNGVEHKYTVEGTNILREEYGGHVLDYLYGVDGDIIGFTYDGTAYYYEKNLQGDVIGLTDASGNEITQYTYDAWGKVLFVEGNTEIGNINPIRYRSYYYDSETQLYYLNSRYYDPETCRFINSDEPSFVLKRDIITPINNIFAYCDNNPVLFKDKNGCAKSYSGVVGFGIQIMLSASVLWFSGFVGIEFLWFPFKGINNFGNGAIPWCYLFVGGSRSVTIDWNKLATTAIFNNPKNLLVGMGLGFSFTASITVFLITAKNLKDPKDYTREFNFWQVTAFGVTISKAWDPAYNITTYGIGVTFGVSKKWWKWSAGLQLFGGAMGYSWYKLLNPPKNASSLYSMAQKKAGSI